MLALCVLVCVLLSAGCTAVIVGAGAGAGTFAYVKGVTQATYDAPYNDVWDATGASLDHFGIKLSDKTRDALAGSYKGERHDGTNVIVDIASIARDKTSVEIRVGIFGDRDIQEKIAEDIEKRL